MHSMSRLKPSTHSSILVAIVPVSLTYHFKGHRNSGVKKEQQVHDREVLRNVIERNSCPVDACFNTGDLMLCAEGLMGQCYPVIFSWLAAYFENIHSHSIKQPQCPACEASKLWFKEVKI